jgi:hypothetical protein
MESHLNISVEHDSSRKDPINSRSALPHTWHPFIRRRIFVREGKRRHFRLKTKSIPTVEDIFKTKKEKIYLNL